MRTTLSAQRLRDVLYYDPTVGSFTWIRNTSNRSRKNKGGAGYIRRDRRRVIQIDGQMYLASRLAWLYMTGAWPQYFIDHRDLDPGNDKFDNLREADASQNRANAHIRSRFGIKGLSKNGKAWQARIWDSKTCVCLGTFPEKSQAGEAYMQAAYRIHGEFARAS